MGSRRKRNGIRQLTREGLTDLKYFPLPGRGLSPSSKSPWEFRQSVRSLAMIPAPHPDQRVSQSLFEDFRITVFRGFAENIAIVIAFGP